MAQIRSINELILSALDFYRTAQPQLDTKPGTVARDLLVDGPSTQLAGLYEKLSSIKAAQSLRLSLGTDLDRLAQNFGVIRKRGSVASGTAIFTFASIDADIPINSGDIVTARNGAAYTVTTGITVSSVFSNTYRAVASRYRSDLDLAGITDEYAVEVSVEATSPGIIGNISKYSLTSVSTSGVSNVTNAEPFGGGSQPEDDATFRNRVLALFSGANTGTTLGYQEAAKSDSSVVDALVVGPGHVLMTRDGTEVNTAEDGTKTIISDGTGGKVDLYVMGTRLLEVLDSFIYLDKSNKNDPTSTSNDFVLGQIDEDDGKTVTKKRIDNLLSGVLPDQPVNNIESVTGSSSGPNFVEKQTDSFGRVTGNYELIRDDGVYSGSPWGFDRLRWISDRISFNEDLTKGRFNGQDSTSFSDVLKIGSVTQNFQVTNENSTVTPSDRSSIQLKHSPITNVTRVFNLTTGERYIVADQAPDDDGGENTTGRIVISGSTLPAISDILQVDYTWLYEYDENFDFDNRLTSYNVRSVIDSVDWGFSNNVVRERQNVVVNGSQLTVTVTHPVSAVASINTFVSETSVVQLVSGRIAVVVVVEVDSVVSVVRNSDGAELYNTENNDGSFSGFTIFLPTDTVANFADSVTVVYNAEDTFTVDDISGSFDDNVITLSSSASVVAGTTVECNYIANTRTLITATLLSELPILKNTNGFATSTTASFGTQPCTNVFSLPGVVEQNLRRAPTRLGLNIAGAISSGVITVQGTTFHKISNAIISVSTAGLTHDLSAAIRSYLGLSSSASIPSNVSVARVVSVEDVELVSSGSNEVMSVINTYGVKGYKLLDNSFVKLESVKDIGLTRTQFSLPSTSDNIANLPEIGDKLRITFYITKTSDSENVSFSKSGILYTDKIFGIVDSVSISSGFTSAASQSATLTVSAQNQPAAGGRYTVFYDYLAPKPNERITIRYNLNQLIKDTTLTIEGSRPVTADVLVKAAVPLLVNIEFSIVVSIGYENSSTIVAQNVRDAITAALNATSLGTTIDESDFINAAYSVDGVDRVRTVAFNKDGEVGRVLSITADDNEYIQANNVTITVETR